MANPFKIQKKQVLGLGNWLGRLSLTGRESRMRTRFIAMLEEVLANIEKERKAMISDIAEKDDNGELKVVEEDDTRHYVIPDELKAKFEADLNEMYDEYAELSGPESATIIQTVKNIVLNCEEMIDPTLAGSYDAWCSAFESWNPSNE